MADPYNYSVEILDGSVPPAHSLPSPSGGSRPRGRKDGPMEEQGHPAPEPADASALRRSARRLLDQFRHAPGPVRIEAVQLSARAQACGQPVTAAIAEHAAGLAASWRGDVAAGLGHLERGIELAADDPVEQATIRSALAYLLARNGSLTEALDVAGQALPLLAGPDLGRLLSVLGFIYGQLGDLPRARDHYDASVAALEAADDPDVLAGVLSNRGVFEWIHGGYEKAIASLTEALAINRGRGRVAEASATAHNLGLAHIAAGDVPLGLRLMEEASSSMDDRGFDRSVLLLDRCRVLVELGLAGEALNLGHEAARLLITADARLELSDLALILARAALALDNPDAAAGYARQALKAFVEQGRDQAAGVPRALLGLAQLMGDSSGSEQALLDLELEPRDVDPATALHLCVRLLDQHRLPEARQLAEITLRNLESNEGAGAAVQSGIARTVLASVAGEPRLALAAMNEGISAAEQNVALLGSIEMRALTLRQATRLGALGCQAGLNAGDAVAAFTAVERARMLVTLLRPPTPGTDQHVDELLAEIRRLEIEIAERPDASETAQLHHDRAQREQELRSRARQRSGRLGAPASAAPSLEELASRLGDRAVTSFAAIGGTLQAFVLRGDGQLHHRSLGPSAPIESIVEDMQRGLLAYALGRSSNMALRRLDRAKAALWATVLHPLESLLEDRDLVIVPGGGLDGVPWPLFERLLGRSITLSSGAFTWKAPTAAPPQRPLIAAGPGLEHADLEAAAVAGVYRHQHPSLLGAGEATVEKLMTGLAGADLLHLCAHGRFRADNPMLSHLQVSDGPLYVYDLDHAPTVPPLMVFSACEVGLGVVAPEGSLVGIAAALTGRGCERIVASAVPVRDDETAELMLQLHHALLAGVPVETALAQAQATLMGHGALSVAGFAVLAVA
ncbi:MAG: Tetratricopeptide repeat protein 28 [Acidimicrobiia bacterium]|nr:Tetratricopeptide repeat protein 28 [Acidimicrobiia bacterium]